MPLILPLLLLIFGEVRSKNVFVITTAAGSHQYLSAEIAALIAERGHNVSLISLMPDPRVSFDDRPFTNIYLKGSEYFAEFSDTMDMMVREIVNLPTELGFNSMFSLDLSEELGHRLLSPTIDILFPYFNDGPFQKLLDTVPISLVVIEESALFSAKIKLIKAGIPVIGVSAISEYMFSRSRENNPMLLNSEPNQVDTKIGDTPPSISDRLNVLGQIFQLIYVIIVKLSGGAEIARYFEEAGVTMEESDRIFSAIFVYDHPALSFPSLTPPYMFNMGFFHLDRVQTLPLPEKVSQFMADCGYVIFMSFGSYAQDLTVIPFVAPMLRGLAAVQPEICLILKTKQDLAQHAPGLKILQISWVPQKDLLASGKVSMFVSHCGNNGRMESLFYGVPLLCVPLFGDQYYNARMVERRQFGRLVPKENITEETFRAEVERFLGLADTYRINIAVARDFVKTDPSSGREMFLFICEHILGGGDLSFLKNRILQQQGMREVYNLDIIGVAVLLLALVVGILLWMFCNCLRCMCKRGVKNKTE